MVTDQIIGVVGAGNIGRALIGGILKAHEIDPSRLRASRRNPALAAELRAQFPGVQSGTDPRAAARGASIVVLAVKPQGAAAVIAEIRDDVADDALVISVLAGLTTDAIREAIGRDVAIIRAMPNTPMIVDEGATALAPGVFATDRHMALARQLFEAVGMVEIVPEYLMDAVTGLSGSGPAYVYMIIEALTDGGVKQGIPRPQAFKLATQTVFGAAKLVRETGKHPAILRDEVTTPGGTAIAAVADLEAHGLRTMLINAVATATARSQELARLGGSAPSK